MKILLVAGHGQNDPGAGGGGYHEREVMRQIITSIKNLIPDVADLYDMNLDCYQQNGLATTQYKEVIEFHMDGAENVNAKGGHVIIAKGYNPDALDNRLKDVIQNHIGIWGGTPSGFSYRDNLQNLNVAKRRGISYRLLELGFITNGDDRNKVIGNMGVLVKSLAEAISGRTVAPNPQPTPPTKPPVASKPNTTAGAHLPVKLDGNKSKAHLDEFGQNTATTLYTRGWHLGGYKYQYLFIMDYNTDREIARKLAKGVSRPDVNKAFNTTGNVGFSESWNLALFRGRKIYVMARCTNDPTGNTVGGFSDIAFKDWFHEIPK